MSAIAAGEKLRAVSGRDASKELSEGKEAAEATEAAEEADVAGGENAERGGETE